MKTDYEIYKSIRKDWGNVKPTTKAFKNKKAYDRKKQKEQIRKEQFEK